MKKRYQFEIVTLTKVLCLWRIRNRNVDIRYDCVGNVAPVGRTGAESGFDMHTKELLPSSSALGSRRGNFSLPRRPENRQT